MYRLCRTQRSEAERMDEDRFFFLVVGGGGCVLFCQVADRKWCSTGEAYGVWGQEHWALNSPAVRWLNESWSWSYPDLKPPSPPSPPSPPRTTPTWRIWCLFTEKNGKRWKRAAGQRGKKSGKSIRELRGRGLRLEFFHKLSGYECFFKSASLEQFCGIVLNWFIFQFRRFIKIVPL